VKFVKHRAASIRRFTNFCPLVREVVFNRVRVSSGARFVYNRFHCEAKPTSFARSSLDKVDQRLNTDVSQLLCGWHINF